MSSRGKKKRAKENNLVCRGYFYLSRKELIESDSEERLEDLNGYILDKYSNLRWDYHLAAISSIEAVRDNFKGAPTFKEFSLDVLERFLNQYLKKIDVDLVDFEETVSKWFKFWAREILRNYLAIFVVTLEKCNEEIRNQINNIDEINEEVQEDVDKEIKRLTLEIGID